MRGGEVRWPDGSRRASLAWEECGAVPSYSRCRFVAPPPMPPSPLLLLPPRRCSSQLDDPATFPQRYGGAFPPSFSATVRNILKRLFRVYAHIYHSHFRQVAAG